MIILNNKKIKTNSQGYLINYNQWSEELIFLLAKKENIKLTKEHIDIIKFIRSFYIQFKISPSIRLLVEEAKKKFGKKKGTSIYLYYLFPNGPAKQATKLAGIPYQVKCI
ncbi:TusE/DsrC/DsvC family sulfur relay protein [Candidatus Providencia siddallii]|uniref:Sulfurtransferase n=1 Tax=Candidatus Providencia siddallii TaxID=1715285 RepID=A0ABP1CG14_9GAMM